MTDRIIYCAKGCNRNDNGTRLPVQTNPPSLICDHCIDNLKRWLRDIVDRYDLLPHFIEHGTAQKDPNAKQGSANVEAPAPMRLEIIDHLDTRRGRHWQGLAPTADRRGTVGTLHAHAQRIRDEHPFPALTTRPTVAGEAAFLERHLLWLSEQDWVTEAIRELSILHRQLGDAIGEHQQHAIATCTVDTTDGPCGGPLLPSRLGGVHCPQCGDVWSIDDLRRLGTLLTA